MNQENAGPEVIIDIQAPEAVAPVISSVVHNALTAAGFTSVNYMGSDNALAEVEDMPTVLEMVRENMPDLFAIPVTIYESPDEDVVIPPSVDDSDEVHDPQADVAVAISEEAAIVG